MVSVDGQGVQNGDVSLTSCAELQSPIPEQNNHLPPLFPGPQCQMLLSLSHLPPAMIC